MKIYLRPTPAVSIRLGWLGALVWAFGTLLYCSIKIAVVIFAWCAATYVVTLFAIYHLARDNKIPSLHQAREEVKSCARTARSRVAGAWHRSHGR